MCLEALAFIEDLPVVPIVANIDENIVGLGLPTETCATATKSGMALVGSAITENLLHVLDVLRPHNYLRDVTIWACV
jgi:hypothetical protein